MPSPNDAELLAELTALRQQLAAIEGQVAAYRQAKEVATALAQVGKELAESLDVAQVTDRIVTAILRLVRGRRAALFEHVPASGELICVATAGEAGPGKWLGLTLPPGVGIAGRAIAEGRPVWSADLPTDPSITLPDFLRKRLEEEGYRAAVALPLIARGTVVGALVLSDAAGRVFSEDDLQILTTFAAQAALALENARLYQDEQVRSRQLEAIRTVGVEVIRELDLSTLLGLINRRAAELVGAVSGVVWLWDAEAQVIVPRAWHGHGEWLAQLRLRPGEGVAGTVAERREGLIINDYRSSSLAHPLFLQHTETTAVLAEPLLYRDRLLGVITVDNQVVKRHFTAQDRNTLTLFAAQAAIAIENARLFAEAERRATELRALQEIDQAITTRLELPAVLEAVAAGAMRLLGTQHTQIILWDAASQSLRYGAALGTEADRVRSQRFEPGRGINGVVALTREPMILNDYQASPYVVPECADVVATITTPVLFGDQLLGILHSHTTQPGRRFTADDLRLLQMLASQAAIAIENARLLARSDRAAREARSLYEVAHSLTTSLDPSEVLHLISVKTTELLGTPHAQVVLWDEATQSLRLGAAYGTHADQVKEQAFRLGEGVNGIVAQTRAPLLVNDYQAFPRRVKGLTELQAVIGVPLLYRDRFLGVLTSHATQPGSAFSPDHLALLTSFADQAAIAIEKARLYNTTVRRAQQLATLTEVTRVLTTVLEPSTVAREILQAGQVLIPGAIGRLWEREGDSEVLRLVAAIGTREVDDAGQQVFPAGGGLMGLAVGMRQPVTSPDVMSDPRFVNKAWAAAEGLVSCIILPLLFGERVHGVLNIFTRSPHTFTEEEMGLLRTFASQAAIAIENARLFTELNRSYRDLQQAQDELIRSEKLRALGQMAAGIAHDLNNMLAAVLGQVELLRLRLTDPAARDALSILETAATDGAHVVRRLQDFARQRAKRPLVPTDLATAVQGALEITRPRWRDQPQQQGRIIEVRTSLDGPPPILGHASEVREAVTNLILNAVDAMPQGGTLTLSARAVKSSSGQRVDLSMSPAVDSSRPSDQSTSGLIDYLTGHAALTARTAEGPGDWVELAVTDTGSGMSEEVRRRIFEPFFTTKGLQGTGLGLSVVYGIMERHGGHIHVASAPGQGTTVTLRFRVAAGRAGEPPERRLGLGTTRRILVIDDDPNVREGVAGLLRAAGHQVSEADGGATGIDQLAGHALDLVLTDLGMPGITGWDVARAAKARNPGLPVILMTGWGEQAVAQAEERKLVDRVLAKPFRLEELLEVIRELTSKPPPAGREQVAAGT